jgi:hypothetical protein
VKTVCETERRVGAARIVRVATADPNAGTQYFVVHDHAAGSAVLARLEHHIPGGRGVYRDFRINGARLETIGRASVLRIDSTLVETELLFQSGHRGCAR